MTIPSHQTNPAAQTTPTTTPPRLPSQVPSLIISPSPTPQLLRAPFPSPPLTFPNHAPRRNPAYILYPGNRLIG
ncbi:hypothetical protein EX30DRAFT_340490 [Ascodesmis nigricans]|uniref:REJ domain-containing protein n=1 Tax=Ascodesmis nigricans TaxID=341454 RepID=A0A4S2MYH0_9PEZI|nr:hypothetical protein EX30DRAFT_340490 [Ascodesmis nigricans]